MKDFPKIAFELEEAGLLWQPEIGDEIVNKQEPEPRVSVLVDNASMTPSELRFTYLWLPTVEQMVLQFESRQAILFHAGLTLSETRMHYQTLVQSPFGEIEASAQTLRGALGCALRDLLLYSTGEVH